MCIRDRVKAITESAMRGEIDFTESFTRRVALLKGLDESVMQEIAESCLLYTSFYSFIPFQTIVAEKRLPVSYHDR